MPLAGFTVFTPTRSGYPSNQISAINGMMRKRCISFSKAGKQAWHTLDRFTGGLVRGEHRINLLAGLIESLLPGLHPAKDPLAGIVERLLYLRVGLAAPDARNAVTRPFVEQPGDLAQCAGTLEERIIIEALERGQGKAGLQDRVFVLAAGKE